MRIGKLLLGLGFVLIIASCALSEKFLETPLTAEEERFIGTWTHVEGLGNNWSRTFSEDRTLHTYSENLIWGSSEGFYLWEADGRDLLIYEQNTFVLQSYDTWEYSFSDTENVVIAGYEYSLE